MDVCVSGWTYGGPPPHVRGRVKDRGTHLSRIDRRDVSDIEGCDNAPDAKTNHGGEASLLKIAIVIGPGGAFTGSTRHR